MKTLFLILMTFVIVGCHKHEVITHSVSLRQIAKTSETVSYANGSYFLLVGSYESGTYTQQYIKLLVDMDGEIFFLTYPLSHVSFAIRNNIETPLLFYNSYSPEKRRIDLEGDDISRAKILIVCPEYLLPVQLKPMVVE